MFFCQDLRLNFDVLYSKQDMPKLKKIMFREYNIRRLVNREQLNESSIKLIDKGFGFFLKEHDVGKAIIGFDAREYPEKLKNALVKSIISTEVHVVEIGQISDNEFAEEIQKTKEELFKNFKHIP